MYHVESGSFHLTVQTNVLNVDHQDHTALKAENTHVAVVIATKLYFLNIFSKTENVLITQTRYFAFLPPGLGADPR